MRANASDRVATPGPIPTRLSGKARVCTARPSCWQGPGQRHRGGVEPSSRQWWMPSTGIESDRVETTQPWGRGPLAGNASASALAIRCERAAFPSE